jgi:ribosomal protein S18 acetylase RimI-like enzyme
MLKRSYPLQSITAAGPEEYFLAHLAVLPEYEGRGLGRQLLQHAEQRALAAGLRKITLTVDADNDGAMSLYARAGFRVTSSANLEPLRRKFGYNGYHHMEKLLA